MPLTASSPMSPPGKEDGRDHERVGRERDALAPDRHDRLVVERREDRVAEAPARSSRSISCDGQLAAAAVAEQDLRPSPAIGTGHDKPTASAAAAPSRGHRRSLRRGQCARTGSTRRTRPRPRPSWRRAGSAACTALPNAGQSGGFLQPAQDLAADAQRRLPRSRCRSTSKMRSASCARYSARSR